MDIQVLTLVFINHASPWPSPTKCSDSKLDVVAALCYQLLFTFPSGQNSVGFVKVISTDSHSNAQVWNKINILCEKWFTKWRVSGRLCLLMHIPLFWNFFGNNSQQCHFRPLLTVFSKNHRTREFAHVIIGPLRFDTINYTFLKVSCCSIWEKIRTHLTGRQQR